MRDDGKETRFLIGFGLTVGSISSFVALAFWLGIILNDWMQQNWGDPWRFYSIGIGVWLATIYMYIISFFRPFLEKNMHQALKKLERRYK